MAELGLKIGDKTYNKAWVDNVSSTSQISSDAGSVNYGVIASTGSAKMRDINGQIRADIENGVLPISNAPTKVIINGNQIQEHITSDSDYNIIDKKLDLQFSDRLSLLDKVTYVGMPLREYSMTAYEMLDDVIGSYGGYCKERVVNWTKYQHADKITIDDVGTLSVQISGTTTEYPIIGTKIKVTPNVQHKIAVSLDIVDDYDGNARFQILKNIPTDGDNFNNEIIGKPISEYYGEDLLILTFTPTVDTVYAVINFGYATKTSQVIEMSVVSVQFDDWSLSKMTTDLMPSGLTIAGELEKREINYPYLPSATYRETIEKFCTFIQITLALDENGKAIFHCARPIATRENTLVIPTHYKISNLQKTLVLKNKIDGVDIKQSKPVEKINKDVAVYNMATIPTDYETNANNAVGAGNKVDGSRSVEMETYYTTFDVKIPQRNLGLNEIIKSIETGKKDNGDRTVYYDVKWNYRFYQHEQLANLNWKDTLLFEEDNVGDIFSAKFSTDGKVDSLPNPFAGFVYKGEIGSIYQEDAGLDIEYSYVKSGRRAVINSHCDDTSSTLTKGIFEQDENGDFVARINLLVGKKATVFPTLATLGYYGVFIPKSATIQFYGVVFSIDFEEVDNSTGNIENAINPVTINTNELMQDRRAVDTIRDNIMEDYANGVPTATIDLFCGVGDWKNGEIIQPNDTIAFTDDVDRNGRMNDWKVTGRTFKYQGAPTLSLELQRVKSWKKFFASTSYQIVLQSGTPPTTATEIVKTVTIDNLALDTTVPHKQTRFKGIAYNQSNKKLGDFVCYSGEPTNVFRVGDTPPTPQPFSLTITRDSSNTIICKSSIYTASGAKQYVSGIILTEIAQFY